MELMRFLVEKSHQEGEDGTKTHIRGERLQLTKLTDNDDIEAYITTFERMMEVYKVEKVKWAYMLAPQLMGKAQQAYAAMTGPEASDYEMLKEAILRR